MFPLRGAKPAAPSPSPPTKKRAGLSGPLCFHYLFRNYYLPAAGYVYDASFSANSPDNDAMAPTALMASVSFASRL